ncbi:MAG TPA: hypothetical protein VM261_08380 [Kofleriaceae bacterium]|nr:hypothetical protein [Kofleriaceae bacterium]
MLIVGAIALVLACGGTKAAPVADLLEGQGAVEREHGGAFASAPIGQPFFVGDAARTGNAAWARLRLRDKAVVRLGADTLVRFVAGGARLETGEATAESGPVVIATEAGMAQIEPGGVLRAIGGAGGTRFQVDIGRAIIQREDGAVTLEGGNSIVVAVGGAIVERIGIAGKETLDAGVAPKPDAGEPVPPATTLAATVKGRGVTQKIGAEPWKPLPAGAATLAAGDLVKLPRGASLELARGNDRALVTGPAEVAVGSADGPLVTPRSGSTRVSARDADVTIVVPGGVIVTRTGGDAGIEIGRRESVARVERGEVLLDGEKSDATARAGETGVMARDGAASVRDLVPSSADVVLPISERAVIHDPSRKVAVKIDLAGACPGGGGVLELADARGSFRAPRRIGGNSALFFAAAGTTRYRVRCDGGGAVKTGIVRVQGDSGAAAVVRTPPANTIETDGRKYTISYQNRLPAITVKWNEARGASTLHILSGGNDRTFDSSSAHDLPAGTLPEGTHTLWITSGGRSSPRTTLKIDFDNAAPTAQITAPPPRAPWDADVTVTGVTVEGWNVSIDGEAAARDSSGRFRATVAAAGKNAFAIRLAHPQHGVHYYLRRRK